jgi:hypothetical protein
MDGESTSLVSRVTLVNVCVCVCVFAMCCLYHSTLLCASFPSLYSLPRRHTQKKMLTCAHMHTLCPPLAAYEEMQMSMSILNAIPLELKDNPGEIHTHTTHTRTHTHTHTLTLTHTIIHAIAEHTHICTCIRTQFKYPNTHTHTHTYVSLFLLLTCLSFYVS